MFVRKEAKEVLFLLKKATPLHYHLFRIEEVMSIDLVFFLRQMTRYKKNIDQHVQLHFPDVLYNSVAYAYEACINCIIPLMEGD